MASMMRSRAVRAPASFAAVMVATSLGFVLVQLDVSIVNVALATIGRDLHANVAACSGSSTPTTSPSPRSC